MGLEMLAPGRRSAVLTLGFGGGVAAKASFFGADGAGAGAAGFTGAATGLMGCAGGILMAAGFAAVVGWWWCGGVWNEGQPVWK